MVNIDLDYDDELGKTIGGDTFIDWCNLLISVGDDEKVPTYINVGGYRFAVIKDEGVTSGDGRPVYTLGELITEE